MIKKLLLLATLLTGALFAQNVTVTGTVSNPNGAPLAGGVLTATLTNASGVSYDNLAYNAQTASISRQELGTVLDANGSFSLSLASNSLVTGSFWSFTICSPSANAQCATVIQSVTSNTSLSVALSTALLSALNVTSPTNTAINGVADFTNDIFQHSTTLPWGNYFAGFLAGSSVTSAKESVVIGYRSATLYTGTGLGDEDGLLTCIGALTCSSAIANPSYPANAIAIGQKTAENITDFNGGVFIGNHAGTSLSEETNSIVIGFKALNANVEGVTTSTSQNSVLIGEQIASNGNTGAYTNVVLVGALAGLHLQGSSMTVAVGAAALQAATVPTADVAIGYEAGNVEATGTYNGFIGYGSGGNQVSGSNNNFFGAASGIASSARQHNHITVIGTGSVGDCDNCTVIGRTGANDVTVISESTFTVATLPACPGTTSVVTQAFAVVSDATLPTYNGALTGGGGVKVPVFCNGTAWVSH